MSSLGATIRQAFGPHERKISEIYRRIFVDLDDFAARMSTWAAPRSILEIGCGEGALAERLVRAFPQSEYLGIDIIPHLGRLYDAPRDRARFQQIAAIDLVGEARAKFNLVVISDVLHHVPLAARRGLLHCRCLYWRGPERTLHDAGGAAATNHRDLWLTCHH